MRVTVLGLIATLVILNGTSVRSRSPRQAAPQAIRGRVIAADTGQPLPNARIVVSGSSVATRTGLDGRFTITVPPAATLVITKPGFVQFDQPAGARQAAAQPLEFGLTRASAVSGHVTNEYGDPVVGASAFLASLENPDRPMKGLPPTTTDDRGEYRIGGVAPGTYVISVRTEADRCAGPIAHRVWTEGEFAAYAVTVGRNDITGLVVQTSTGTTVTGRVTYESLMGAAPPERSVVFSAIPTDFDLAPPALGVADLNADGTFQLNGITGVRRLQATTLPPNWRVKSMVSDGIDVTDQALDFGRPAQATRSFDVVLSDRVNAVSGKVTDDRARSVAGARVVVFSADRDRWYPASRFIRSAETAVDGLFSITGVPAGSYFIAAVARTPAGDEAWRDPAFLDSIRPGARSITMGDEDTQTVNLKVSSR